MKTRLSMLWMFVLLNMPFAAFACPPGFYATGGGQAGWHACAPMGPMEEPGQEDGAEGSRGNDLPPIHFSPRQWQEWAEAAKKAEEWREAERMKDPVYRKLKPGYWDHASSAPGDVRQICMASFLTPRGGVLLMDWAGEHKGTFLAFFGAGVPKVATITRTPVSLKQRGERQSVQAFHAPLPWARDIGMVMFAVPSTRALLDAIEDVQDFEVEMGGRTVAWGEWHSGGEARKRLGECIGRRR